MNPPQMGVRQRWAALAQGLQQDLKDYAELRELLGAQYRAALRHDAPAMQQLAQDIEALADRLDQVRRERVLHARALLPEHAPLSMAEVFVQLPPALRSQFERLWQRLLELVQACKQDNQRNGRLIVEQAELMQSVILGKPPQLIYAPL